MPGNTNTNPILSVIVANYNSAQFLRECLDSILTQTYTNLEIVISDDASTDSSRDIIKEYEEKYPESVRAIFSSRNRGVAAARHEAILHAEGDYITTLDSDDYYCNNRKLEKEIEITNDFKKKTGRDILAFSNILLVREEKGETTTRVWGNSDNIKEGFIFADILSRSCMIPRDFILKRSAYFEVGGYDLSIPIYEDWDLKLRLARHYAFHYTGINGTAYRKHGGGLSSAAVPEHNKWLNHIFDKHIPLTEGSERDIISQKFQEFLTRLNSNR